MVQLGRIVLAVSESAFVDASVRGSVSRAIAAAFAVETKYGGAMLFSILHTAIRKLTFNVARVTHQANNLTRHASDATRIAVFESSC